MEIDDKKLTKFSYVIEGVGASFVTIFLAAYLAGIPTTAVYHSEPIIRIPLFIIGAVLVELVLCAVVLAALTKR